MNFQDHEKQHLLSQFYMRGFGKKFFCYDKINNKVIPTNPSKTGYANDFYKANGTPWGEAETLLGDMENEFERVLSECKENYRIKKISSESHYTMSTITAMQMLRTSQKRIDIGNFNDKELDKVGKKYLGEDIMRKIRMLPSREAAICFHRISLLGGFCRIADILFEKEMFLIENTTQTPFWTSDNPVVPYNETDDYLGLSFSSTRIFFPLSGTTMAVFLNSKDRLCGDEDFVSLVNLFQLMNSNRFVYSSTNDFGLAKALLSKYPEYANPGLQKIVVN